MGTECSKHRVYGVKKGSASDPMSPLYDHHRRSFPSGQVRGRTSAHPPPTRQRARGGHDDDDSMSPLPSETSSCSVCSLVGGGGGAGAAPDETQTHHGAVSTGKAGASASSSRPPQRLSAASIGSRSDVDRSGHNCPVGIDENLAALLTGVGAVISALVLFRGEKLE